jgi:thiol-disulfide isomerase/thioredoxin
MPIMKHFLSTCILIATISTAYAQQQGYYNKALGVQPKHIIDSIISTLDISKSKYFLWITKTETKKDSIIFYWQYKQQDKTLDKVAQQNITKTIYGNSYTDVNGKRIPGILLKNKVVVISYWADYCLPCIREIGVLSAIRNHFVGDTNIVFFAPCFEKQGQCKTITNTFDFTYSVLNKKSTLIVNNAVGIYRFPTTIIINKYGIITHYYHHAAATIPGVKPKDEPLYLTLIHTIATLGQ